MNFEAVRHRRSGASPSSIWRTWASTDADGLVKLDVQLPEHTGRIRWMAVAVQDDQYGSANFATTQTSPLLVETSWPRFAAPGDKLHVPVKFFNATNQPLEVTLALQTSGPLEIAELADAAPRTVEPGKPVTLWLDATANGLGDAEVTVLATATSAEMGALSSQQRIKLPVRAATTRASHSRVVTIRAGEKTQFNLPAGFIPEQSRQSLAISSLPELQLLPAINDLIDYPYGCLEQTSSRMSALLAASQVLALSPEHAERRVAIDDLLDAGISRLWSMQTTSGGLGYWGGRESDLWGTAYATSILADAAQRGRSVDPRFMSELTKYLSASLDGRDGSQLDDNVDQPGPILLQGDHGSVAFRNIRIKTL